MFASLCYFVAMETVYVVCVAMETVYVVRVAMETVI